MPWWRREPGSVRAKRMAQSAATAPLVHTFWPVITQSSPSRSARVRRLARSEPASGSENSWHQMWSPRRMAGRKCCCWAGGRGGAAFPPPGEAARRREEAAPAELVGPGGGAPSALVQLALPGPRRRRDLDGVDHADVAVGGTEAGGVIGHPGADLGAEDGLRRRVVGAHRR